MNIIFKNIEMTGFQSIGYAKIDLVSQGIVMVKGINNYESNASSNGSGKSTIFEGLAYAIYGKTSNGISDPTNRYMNNGCCVKVEFNVDNQDYTIIRSIKDKKYGTGLLLLRGNDDISGRNKTDTEKMIKNDILKIDMDIFLSTIFLSQGFSGRISSLSPSGRKERIETLTDTVSLIDEFKERVSNIKGRYSESLNELNRDRSYKYGKKDNVTQQITDLADKIVKSEVNKPAETEYDISSEIDSISSIRSKIEDSIKEIESSVSDCRANMRSVYSLIDSLKNERAQNQSMIRRMDNNGIKVCPTCGQKVDSDKHKLLIEEYSGKIAEVDSKIETESSELDRLTKESERISKQRELIYEKKRRIDSKYIELTDKLSNIRSYRGISEDKDRVVRLKSELLDLGKEIDELDKQISEQDTMLSVVTNIMGLVSKQFRGYLLQEIINFMNSRLKIYSEYLFSSDNESIKLSVDSSKLDIYLGDVLYDTLSGGEKKKVDLALVLAQRDLALNIAGFSCNVLILDEVLENLDNTATTCSLNLLMEASSDIESMFIISHNNYSIQSDSVITVEKDKDRISHVKIDVI